jgi:hypothetical protein
LDIWEEKECIHNFDGETLGRPKRKLEEYIKMDFREVGCEDSNGSGSCPMTGFGINWFSCQTTICC